MTDLIDTATRRTAYGVSDSSADRWEAAGFDSSGVPFPKRLHVGRRIFYVKAELDTWVADRISKAIAKRDRADKRQAEREATMPLRPIRRRLNP